MIDTDVGGPGGICADCGHFAMRHQRLECLFPKEPPCKCKGMKWLNKRYVMDQFTGPIEEVA